MVLGCLVGYGVRPGGRANPSLHRTPVGSVLPSSGVRRFLCFVEPSVRPAPVISNVMCLNKKKPRA